MRKKDRPLFDATLNNIAFYMLLSEPWKKSLIERMYMLTYEEGDMVVRKGRSSGAFFIIASGVMQMKGEDGQRDFKELNSGDFFGVSGLSTGDARTYSIVAKEASQVFIMGKDEFAKMLDENPEAKIHLESEVRELEQSGGKVAAPESGTEKDRHEEKVEGKEEKSFLKKLKSYLKFK